ncbi:MAG: hypothetical protein BM557_09555 [Flavobacterium sp. MedPE-SWcel]|uniref:hypothetical protein n=1 Tax=uncultured Flavobacterium sp. TaxID=165435 RepID=UPI000919E462|nr:hypothetical protein [uncultured Flavobacterium sp.]OIQ16550.1 MAG: hypothetical protein BM557_09555 [Flavobacterium sp. MedPE-SWcel]
MADNKKPYIAKLDTKVRVYRLDKQQDATGATVDDRVLVCDTYAALGANTGGLDLEEKVTQLVNASYVIRKRNGIVGVVNLELEDTETDKVYKVHYVRKIGRSHLELICVDYD